MNGDITDLKRSLEAAAQSVAEYLLPGGRREAAEWRAGSVGGERGQSLGVHLSGNKAGVWSDFATGESGDLIDLWGKVKGTTLTDTLDAIRKWLGVETARPYREPKKAYVRPQRPQNAVRPKAKVLDYLTVDRNIPGHVIDLYKIAEQGDRIIFPFLTPEGELVLIKARKVGPNQNPMPTTKDAEPILFGWQAIPPDAREVTLVEGEIDAPSMTAYGWPAMSVPFGGGKGAKQGNWIENEFERMQRFERIYLALDNDKPGEEAAEEIAARLGRHRCLRVLLPKKDANDCLMAGVTKAEIDAAFANATSLDPEGLLRPTAYRDQVQRRFFPGPDDSPGYRLPYHKEADLIRFRPAEVTVWSGSSGSGKSQLLSDCTADWVEQGSRVCLVSLEMKGHVTLTRLVKQVVGTGRPTPEAVDTALRWLDRGLLLWERVGKAGLDALMAVLDYARAKYGCDQFIIDSFMRLGIAKDDYSGQEAAMFKLVDWAINNNVHLHLVAHSKKGERSERHGPPEGDDIRGAGEIGDNAFNIITVWRSRKHEDEIRALEAEIVTHGRANAVELATEAQARLDEEREKPGVVINVAKQRNGDFEGKISAWFDRSSYRYRTERNDTDEAYRRDYIGDLLRLARQTTTEELEYDPLA